MKRRILTILLGITILMQTIGSFPIPTAKAAIPVMIADAVIHAQAAAIAAATTKSAAQQILDWLETFALSTLKRRLLDVLVDQVVSYIQGGGQPQFVTDWKGFLEDAGQAAAGDFAKELGAGFLCEPFRFGIQINFYKIPTFAQKAECTLDKIVGNINNFYNDFRNGGWLAYGTSLQPRNNYFGALIMALQENEIRKSAAAFAAYNEAQAGDGFISQKKCELFPDGTEKCRIITPGSTVGDLVSKAVGKDFDFILNAQQLGEYASAIANSLVNRLVAEGLTGLQESITDKQQDDITKIYNEVLNNSFDQQKTTFLDEIDQTLVPRQQAGIIVNLTIDALIKFKADLQKLHQDFTNLPTTICIATPLFPSIVVVTQVKDAILNEISATDATIALLQADKAANQAIIDPLVQAKADIASLQKTETDFAKMGTIYNSITSILKPIDASSFKSAIEAMDEEVATNITQKLAGFNLQLTQCQLTNP
ncbi:MAG: Uncharacterized protein G01um10143_290 [Parcubacteria group bacterium Gr01-1014_3]|nr:MAG: Uncharacterized protein G01um10143_290 [Parcubacteria group bacterium Gr01-1014_3]